MKGFVHYIEEDLAAMEAGRLGQHIVKLLERYLANLAEFERRYGA